MNHLFILKNNYKINNNKSQKSSKTQTIEFSLLTATVASVLRPLALHLNERKLARVHQFLIRLQISFVIVSNIF